MSIQVIYFSRTGTSEGIAKDLAMHLDLELYQLQDDMNWRGIWGFLKGGYYAAKNKPVTYRLFNVDKGKVDSLYKPADVMIIVTPLWAGGAAPAARTFIRDIQKNQQPVDPMGMAKNPPEIH